MRFHFQFVYVPLIENLTWSADAFLCRYGSTLLAKIRGATDKMSATYMERLQQQWLQAKSQRLNRDTQTCCTQASYDHEIDDFGSIFMWNLFAGGDVDTENAFTIRSWQSAVDAFVERFEWH